MIYKKLFLTLIVFAFIVMPSFAEKIPVKIAPIQVISTNHDEIEVGDWIDFEVVNDVYVNDNLYIKSGTKIAGVVDFIHNNGWGGDSADIVFKTFYTTDINNKKITINYPMDIDGKSEMANNTRSISNKVVINHAPRVICYFVPNLFYFVPVECLAYVGFVIRGAEIFVEPDTKIYNIFIER